MCMDSYLNFWDLWYENFYGLIIKINSVNVDDCWFEVIGEAFEVRLGFSGVCIAKA
jgi:hypothetical protein